MAIKFNRSQTFATNGTVTAAGLHNLIDGTDIYQALITDQTNLTSVGSGDELLIADADLTANDAPRAVTVNELFEDALTISTYTNANINNISYGTSTGTRIVSTNASITTGTIPSLTSSTASITIGTIPTLTAGTTTSTAANITNGTVQTLTASTANITTGTVATLNSTTGTIASLSATTSTFLGTITGSTNLVNIGSGQIYKDANGDVYFGATSKPVSASIAKVHVVGGISAASNSEFQPQIQLFGANATAGAAPYVLFQRSRGSYSSPTTVSSADNLGSLYYGGHDGTSYVNGAGITGIVDGAVSTGTVPTALTFFTGNGLNSERLRIASDGQIGIGGANYGTSGQALVSNGASSAPSWQSVSAITMATAVASTSGTAIDFTGIPSGVKRITVMFNGVSANGSSPRLVQIGISTGIENSGYVAYGGGGGLSITSSTAGYPIYNGNAADTIHGHLLITNVSGNTWVSSHSAGLAGSGANYFIAGGGSKTLGGTLDRVRITSTNGTDTFDAGSINILYES
jgi:hypothetical protein